MLSHRLPLCLHSMQWKVEAESAVWLLRQHTKCTVSNLDTKSACILQLSVKPCEASLEFGKLCQLACSTRSFFGLEMKQSSHALGHSADVSGGYNAGPCSAITGSCNNT